MKTLLAASAASMFVAMPVLAQESGRVVQLDEINVVSTGTKAGDFGEKSGIPLEKIPQSVQVLDEEDIIARGASTVEDALRAVPSVTGARSEVGTFSSATLRIRGFPADQMRNGIRQRYYEDVDNAALSNIERIEVLKGPSAVLYGESGPGGIVSIITKQPTAKFAGSGALTFGSYGKQMATFDVGGPVNETLGFRLTGEVERSGTFVDFQDINRENLGFTLAWRPSASVSGHLVAEWVNRSTAQNPGLPTVGTVISNGVATVKRSTFLGEPGYSLEQASSPLIQAWVDFKLNDTWTLTPRFQYNEFNHNSKAVILFEPVAGQPTLIPRQGRFAGEHDQFYVTQLDLSGRATTFGIGHKLLFGAEYSADRVNFRMQDNVPCGIGPIDALNPVYGCGAPTSNFGFLAPNYLDGVAVYAQDQIALTEAWNVVAGIRRAQFRNDTEFITDFSSTSNSAKFRQTAWQLGTTYALGQGVSLFGGYNTGYDVERMLQARRPDGTPFKPETYGQFEAGMRLSRGASHASLSAFQIRNNDPIVPDPANIGFNLQEGQYRVQGVELEGEWLLRPGWWLQGGYAYLDGVVSQSATPGLAGAQLAEIPRNSATAFTRVAVGQVELRAGANYVGSRKMVNGGAVTLPGYVSVDLGASTRFGPWRLDAALNNVFDKTYYYSDNASVFSVGGENHVYPGTPRTFRLRATYSF